jgi:hypothetical protein
VTGALQNGSLAASHLGLVGLVAERQRSARADISHIGAMQAPGLLPMGVLHPQREGPHREDHPGHPRRHRRGRRPAMKRLAVVAALLAALCLSACDTGGYDAECDGAGGGRYGSAELHGC